MTSADLADQNTKSNPKAAFHERLEELRTALKVLSISNNLSGRLKFREKWPDVAAHIFGPKLMAMDLHGADDLEARAAEENEAEMRRLVLKNILAECEEKSVASGILVLDYITGLVDQLGPVLAAHIYAAQVVERVRPGALEALKSAAPAPEEAKLSKAEIDILRNPSPEPPAAKAQTPAVDTTRHTQKLVPKGTLTILYNWLSAQRSVAA